MKSSRRLETAKESLSINEWTVKNWSKKINYFPQLKNRKEE